jgi:trehalose 6-phosphate phosphatase
MINEVSGPVPQNSRSPRPPAPEGPWCLFLDVDGTLLDIAETPDAVQVDGLLLDLLRRLHRISDGALALITGRTIPTIDSLFAPLHLAVAGVHGFERRNADGRYFRPSFVGPHLHQLRTELTAIATSLHGTLLEDKGCGFAMHYRQAPNLEETIRLRMARLVTTALPTFELLEGNNVIEIKPAEHSKATAIEAFMQEAPFTGRTPIFIGDDATDLDGLAAVKRFGGLAIAVGSRPGDTRLATPGDVRDWLTTLASGSRALPRNRKKRFSAHVLQCST